MRYSCFVGGSLPTTIKGLAMKDKTIDDIPQITQGTASESLMEWFDDRAEELFQDDVLRRGCIIKWADGREFADAYTLDGMDQLGYDCCCDEAWQEAKVKWINGELS